MVLSKKILLVEDDKSVAHMTQRVINGIDSSLEVIIAGDSEVAMELLNAGDISLALIDGNLNDGPTGPIIARAARGLEIPFIVTSSDKDLIEEFRRYEPVAYATKPNYIKRLESEIKKFYSL